MGKQLRKGTQFPLRPAIATFKLATGTEFDMPNDTGIVAWNTAGHQCTPVLDAEMMNDVPWITVSGTVITLQPGIYKIQFHPTVTNMEIDEQHFALAITNTGGSVVYAQTQENPGIQMAPLTDRQHMVQAVAHLVNATGIQLRAVQNSTGALGELVLSEENLATIERIGNENES